MVTYAQICVSDFFMAVDSNKMKLGVMDEDYGLQDRNV